MRVLLPACLCVVFAAARAADLPDPSRFDRQPVASVRFEPAEQPLTAEQLSRILPLKPGTPVDASAVRAAIKNLYRTGRYSYVEVDAEPSPRGVALTVRTRDQWFIGPVEVKGKLNTPPNTGQLENAARLEFGQAFDESQLKDAVENIQNLFQRNGFYMARVTPQTTRDDQHQQVNFTFQVDPGKRARLNLPIITGDPRIDREKVAKAAKYKGLFRWKLATADTVNAGIQRIDNKYAKDDRLTAAVSLENMSWDRERNFVRPTINVEGGPKVKISTVGAKVSRKKLEAYVPVFDEGTVNRDLLVEGASNLRDYFQINGYFEAEVDFQRRTVDKDHERIDFVVTPGERHKLVDVSVRGNRYFNTASIRERMYLQTAGLIRLRHGRYSQGFVRRDEGAVKALYQSNGFRDVKVSIQTIDDYKGKAGDVAAVVNIDEGPQYFVSGFKISGMTHLDAGEIEPMLASSEGQPFSDYNVGLDRDFIIRSYQSAGFLNAAFEYRSSPGPGPHRVNLEYIVAEGPRRFVRDVVISGMRNTSPRLVDPNVLLKAGDPLSWTTMGDMQRRLYELGVFDKVNMAVQNPTGATDQKYVLYHLEEGHRYSVAAGLGGEFAKIGGSQYSLDNPAGQAGFSPRVSLDVSRMNMWGLGHTLSLKSRYSSLDRRAILEYSAPRYRNVDGRNITLTAEYDDTRDVRTFTAKRYESSAQLSQKISKATTAFWRLSYRDSRVDQATLKISPLLVPLLAAPAKVGMIAASVIQDRRDDPSNAHRGVYNTADLGFAPHQFGSSQAFLRFLARNSWYKPVKGDYVLASNTSLGIIKPYSVHPGVDPTQAVPLPERFFGGGSTSMRGFADNQAGPRDAVTGFPLGGNALFFHSTELRFPFIGDNIDGVFFHDMGNIYSGLSNISFRVHQKNLNDFDYMVHAVGFGIRYRTPLGPVRIDLAYSINPPSFYGYKGTYQELLFNQATKQLQNTGHFQFFFSIGQAF